MQESPDDLKLILLDLSSLPDVYNCCIVGFFFTSLSCGSKSILLVTVNAPCIQNWVKTLPEMANVVMFYML